MHLREKLFYKRKRPKYPLSVTITALCVLFVLLWNLIRIYGVILNWQILSEFGASPLYILSTALFWTITSSGLIRAIWHRSNQAIRALQVSSVLYFAWYWLDRIYIQSSPPPNTVFSAFTSTIILILFSVTLCTPSARAFLNGSQHD